MSELEKLKIKKINIKKLVDQYDWKGSGTETDPYIIEATQDLPRALHFKTKALYVKMLNVQHFSVKLKQCQNFTIENCAFCHLEVQECWNIDIKNSLFGSLTISNLKGNTFENNKIEKQGLKGLYHHKPNENAGRVLIVLFFVEFLLLSLILNIIGYTYWNYISILKSTWIVLFYFFAVIGLVTFVFVVLNYGIVVIIASSLRLRKLETNKLVNNSELTAEEYSEKICENCLYRYECLFGSYYKYKMADMREEPQIQSISSQSLGSPEIPHGESKKASSTYSVKYPTEMVLFIVISSVLFVIVTIIISYMVEFFLTLIWYVLLAFVIFSLVGWGYLGLIANKKLKIYKNDKVRFERLRTINTFEERSKKRFCIKCGNKVSFTTKFCTNCGKKI